MEKGHKVKKYSIHPNVYKAVAEKRKEDLIEVQRAEKWFNNLPPAEQLRLIYKIYQEEYADTK